MKKPDSTPIVVGVDETLEALNAAHFALREATLRGRTLVMIYAYGYPPQYVRGEAALVLADVAEQLPAQQDVIVEQRIVEGDAVPALLDAADEANLLIVGRHRTGIGAHLLAGSVSSALSSRAACPVVTIPERWYPSNPADGPVVAVVDSEASNDDTLAYAFGRAQLADVPLVVLQEGPPPTTSTRHHRHSGIDATDLIARWATTYPEVDVTTRNVQHSADSAVKASWSASLLVVGRPRSIVEPGSWTRSIGRAIVRHTLSPVVVVPSTDIEESAAARSQANDVFGPTY